MTCLYFDLLDQLIINIYSMYTFTDLFTYLQRYVLHMYRFVHIFPEICFTYLQRYVLHIYKSDDTDSEYTFANYCTHLQMSVNT